MCIGTREEAVLVEVIAEVYAPNVKRILAVRRVGTDVLRFEVVVARTCDKVVLLIVEFRTIVVRTLAEVILIKECPLVAASLERCLQITAERDLCAREVVIEDDGSRCLLAL